MFHKLKSSTITPEALAAELNYVLTNLKLSAGEDLYRIYLFGSAAKGISAMHQYSDIDLCVVLRDKVDLKMFRRKVPISRGIPIDWIIVLQSDFEASSRHDHGIYAKIDREGKILFEAGAAH